uniref:Odorant-binding protein 23 n=1 Tax=Pyrrhalta maculicollis TaxID=226885 RepID=A0A1J0KKS8_9CUCU|nr:odorant-binding protein 23 [Pyrrhalta maculicollis]
MKFILLAAVCIGGVSCIILESEFNEKLQKISKEAHRICVKETGITQEAIDHVKKGNFYDDLKTKKYNNCLWRNTQVMGENFKLDEKLLMELVPEKARDLLFKGISECFEEARAAPADLDFIEKTYSLSKCIHDKSPENWFYF